LTVNVLGLFIGEVRFKPWPCQAAVKLVPIQAANF